MEPNYAIPLQVFEFLHWICNQPVDPELLEEPSQSEIVKICRSTDWISRLCTQILDSNELETSALAYKPPIEIAAFFYALMPSGGRFFRGFADGLPARELSRIMIELLRHEPYTFLMLIQQLPEDRVGAVMEEIQFLDRDNFYRLILDGLLVDDDLFGISRWLLTACTPQMRRSIAVESVWNTRYTLSALHLFIEYEDHYHIFNEILVCHLQYAKGPLCLGLCLEKMLPHWLEKRPFEDNDPQAEIFYKIDSRTFIYTMQRIVKNRSYTQDMRSELLHALDWNRICSKNVNSVQQIGALLSLAGTPEEIEKVMTSLDVETHLYGDPLKFERFAEDCLAGGLYTLLAYVVLHLPESKRCLLEKNENLLAILYRISMVSDQFLLPWVKQCPIGMMKYFVEEKLDLHSTDEGLMIPSVVNISTLELLKTLQEDSESPLNLFLQQMPRILLIFAMRHPRGHELLAGCYRHLSEGMMRNIETFLPENMLKIPSMLPFVGDMRCNMIEHMDSQDYQLVRQQTSQIVEASKQRIEEARNLLEEELGQAKPDLKRLKTQCTKYQQILADEGDIDPGMRRYLSVKRERTQLEDSEEGLFTVLKKLHACKQQQLMPTEPIVRAQMLINGSAIEDCLSEYIFNIVPKGDWQRLALVGIESDRDLRVIGLDLHTQDIVEAYRQQLAACIVDEKERHETLKEWRKLCLLSSKEMSQKAKLIAAKMNRGEQPPVPPKPQGMSRMIPSRKGIREGSWVKAVKWVVKASADYIWQKYSSQDNLEQTWEKWEGQTLATCGITKRSDLLNLSQIQSKKHKPGQ